MSQTDVTHLGPYQRLAGVAETGIGGGELARLDAFPIADAAIGLGLPDIHGVSEAVEVVGQGGVPVVEGVAGVGHAEADGVMRVN